MTTIRDRLRRWLGVPAPFPSSLYGNVRVTMPVNPTTEPERLRIHLRWPSREAMLEATGHIHAVSIESDGTVEIHVVADRIDLKRGGSKND